MKTKLHFVLTITMFLFVFSAVAQERSFKKLIDLKPTKALNKLSLGKNNIHFFEFDLNVAKKHLARTRTRKADKTSNVQLTVPGFDGEMQTFTVYETAVFSKALADSYPNIRSYSGISTSHSGAKLRMSLSPQGIQTMITYPDKPTVFMQPIAKNTSQYVLYTRNKERQAASQFECKTAENLKGSLNKTNVLKTNEGGANNKTLQKFRIAISTTAEYTAYHNDGIAANGDAVADALAAINATLSRVNEVFETDMAITFELINAPELIYTDPENDPYSDSNSGANSLHSNSLEGWGLQLQNNLTHVIGNDAYDIGHLFGASGGGGNAGCIGCVCENDDADNPLDKNKGSAFTSPANGVPEGDIFDINFVIHEIGHQMGANHTWAFEVEGANVNSEPGSGSTLMAYAGITDADDVQANSDDYFHYHSIRQILNNIALKSCQTTQAIVNEPPVANAGLDYHIPKGTAYVLKGTADDTNNGDVLTYCWEQIDSGLSNYLNFGPDLVTSPMNRSLPPSLSSIRYIPKFSSVVAGETTQSNPTLGSDWETASNVARDLNWALTVRDRVSSNAEGGQTSYDTMLITVEEVPPFTVNNPVFWSQGTTETITWEVGQTRNATINCQRVHIKLSTDGGLSFPITIASNTPNDGVFEYSVPNLPNTSQARFLVEAADNIFYDVTDTDFSISNEPNFFIQETSVSSVACGSNSITYSFDYMTSNGYSDPTEFSVIGLPAAVTAHFSSSRLSASGSFNVTLQNVMTGDYTFTLVANSLISKSLSIDLTFNNGVCRSFGHTQFQTSTTLVSFNEINNISEKPSGYNNFTALKTSINRGETYDLSVHVNTDGDFTTNTKVWIDWNQNCSFEDVGEAYNLGDAYNSSNIATDNSSLGITIPDDALLGNTLMRVSTKYKNEGLPLACETRFDGEVEDYALRVFPTKQIETFGFDNFKVFPNPNKGVFTVQLNSGLTRTIRILIYDFRGRVVYQKSFQDGGDFKEEITLDHVASGIYILNASDGLKTAIKKVVIK